jgi:hypothetical protein
MLRLSRTPDTPHSGIMPVANAPTAPYNQLSVLLSSRSAIGSADRRREDAYLLAVYRSIRSLMNAEKMFPVGHYFTVQPAPQPLPAVLTAAREAKPKPAHGNGKGSAAPSASASASAAAGADPTVIPPDVQHFCALSIDAKAPAAAAAGKSSAVPSQWVGPQSAFSYLSHSWPHRVDCGVVPTDKQLWTLLRGSVYPDCAELLTASTQAMIGHHMPELYLHALIGVHTHEMATAAPVQRPIPPYYQPPAAAPAAHKS